MVISMNKLSKYIIILCGDFNDNYKPLSRAAFWKLYHKYNDSVERLVESDEEVVKELMKRSGSIAFAIDEITKMGINICTFLDEEFPHRVHDVLKDFCSPMFYTCGNNEINKNRCVGYVGSRNINGDDEKWTQNRVAKNINDGFSVVTGGARGIDTVALNSCIENGGQAILFVPDNITAKIRESFIRKNIIDNKILVYSHVSPLAVKTRNTFVSSAMERNKYIYAMSKATVVVRSDERKGGTWSGATETLKHKWSVVYVRDNKEYSGNQSLIKLGAIPLDDDGRVCKGISNNVQIEEQEKKEYRQCTLMDEGIL